MENSGNEAKKYLKTKEVTVLDGAHFARFVCELRPICFQKEQDRTVLQKPTEAFESSSQAAKVTISRLDYVWSWIGTDLKVSATGKRNFRTQHKLGTGPAILVRSQHSKAQNPPAS